MTNCNISQATYDRIKRKITMHGLSNERASMQDLQDLMRAYEEAVELLDECQNSGIEPTTLCRNVEDFLYLETGEPRVHLDGV